ncbi:MAG TPA: hypothetical protein VHB69_07045 [Mycobacteriales bacterium]|nr:hypothetical protein [Mycobacteriales bacterium]
MTLARLNPRYRHAPDSDRGSIMLALLAIVILTSVVSVGLATVVKGQAQSRHDNAFAQALTGAETGLDTMEARIEAAPQLTSQAAISGTNATTGATYQATASDASGVWSLDSVGTAKTPTGTVTREVQETVTVKGLYGVPLFGSSSLTMGSGSGVDEYDSGATGGASATSCSVLPDTGILGLVATTMCTPATSSTGPAATDGGLTMVGTDLPKFSEVDIDDAPQTGYSDPDATGVCIGDAAVCASSTVVRSSSSLTYPASTACSAGIGVNASAITGSNYLAAGAVYNILGNLTLKAAVTANLTNLSSSGITLCFNGNLLVPSLGALGVTLPWNSYISSALPLQYTPRPPATLMLIDTATSAGSSTITLGDGLNPETALSGVIYAPNAACVVSGHLDLYGAMICGSVSAPGGISVHYDKELANITSEETVTVSNWRELR